MFVSNSTAYAASTGRLYASDHTSIVQASSADVIHAGNGPGGSLSEVIVTEMSLIVSRTFKTRE